MKFIIENEQQLFDFTGINCEERKDNNGTYTLLGLCPELISLAQKYSNERVYFNCIVNNGGSLKFKGQHCFFDSINLIKKTSRLIVTWVDEQNI